MSVQITSGDRVRYECVAIVCAGLEYMAKENPLAICMLLEKCQNKIEEWVSGYNLTESLLKRHCLVNQNGTVDEDVKKIVLCSVKTILSSRVWMSIVHPIDGSYVANVGYALNPGFSSQ